MMEMKTVLDSEYYLMEIKKIESLNHYLFEP